MSAGLKHISVHAACGEASAHTTLMHIPNTRLQHVCNLHVPLPTYTHYRRLKQGKTPRGTSLINRPCPPRVPQKNINQNQICQQRLLTRIWCFTYMNNLCPPKTGPRGSMKHSPTLKYQNKGARSLCSREKTHKNVYNVFKTRNLSRKNVQWLHLKCISHKKVIKQVIYMIKKTINSCHIIN